MEMDVSCDLRLGTPEPNTDHGGLGRTIRQGSDPCPIPIALSDWDSPSTPVAARDTHPSALSCRARAAAPSSLSAECSIASRGRACRLRTVIVPNDDRAPTRLSVCPGLVHVASRRAGDPRAAGTSTPGARQRYRPAIETFARRRGLQAQPARDTPSEAPSADQVVRTHFRPQTPRGASLHRTRALQLPRSFLRTKPDWSSVRVPSCSPGRGADSGCHPSSLGHDQRAATRHRERSERGEASAWTPRQIVARDSRPPA